MIAIFYDRKHHCEVTSAQLGSANVVENYANCGDADDKERPALKDLWNASRQIGDLAYKTPDCQKSQNWDRYLLTQDLVFLRLVEDEPEGIMLRSRVESGSGEAAFPTYEQIRDWLRAHAEEAVTFNHEAEAAPAPCTPGRAVDLRCAWYDEDYDDATATAPMPASCTKPATHWSCCYDLAPCINVCEEHRCRCKQLAQASDSSRKAGEP